MESTINDRIAIIIENERLNVSSFSKLIGIAQTSLRDVVKGGAEPKFSTIEKIIIAKPLIDANWLITGKGEMYKTEYNAGRDIANSSGSGNAVAGNDNVVHSGNGNHVSITGADHGVKKIMKEGETHIEMEQSAEIDGLRQTINNLNTQIEGLKALIALKDENYKAMMAAKDQTIEVLQLLIDSSNKKK